MDTAMKIFLVAPPSLEHVLLEEAVELGFPSAEVVSGGVEFDGNWQDVWRANLCLRGATRVLVRLGGFRAMHLAQLDKRSRKFPWSDFLRTDVPIRVETTSRKSRIYHAGAATQRIERAINDTAGVEISTEAELVLKVRIFDDFCTFSIDTSGPALHIRGHKEALNKAPMRETLASLFLRQLGYDGSQTIVDPMCGSGTFPIEAAEQAAGLFPGRSRSFAFEKLASFDHGKWDQLKKSAKPRKVLGRFFGFDRDMGAIRLSQDNANRATVGDMIQFQHAAISDLEPPDAPAGIVIINPPYGGRIGERKMLFSLYGAMGQTLKTRFKGWRVGILTTDGGLAKATGLPFLPSLPPVPHGGKRVTLHRTDPL